MIKKYRSHILFILILSLSAFLRFYNLSDIYVFNLDEEYQATYAWTLIKDPHPIWIGLVAAALEFYIGPYVVYLTAILLALSKGDPVVTAYFAAFLGVITTAAIFLVGKKVFSQTTGLIAAALYATLPLFVFYDQKYWNPMFGPAITMLLFLSLVLIKQSKSWWVVFAALAGAIFETHLPPVPLILIGLWYFLRGKYYKDIRLITFCILAFLLFYWPLIVFDLNHNFSNLKVFTRLSGNTFNPSAKFGTIFDSLGRFWYLKAGNPNADEINFGCSPLSQSTGWEIIGKYTQRTFAPFWLSLISLCLLLLFVIKYVKGKNFSYKLLSIFLIVSSLSFLIYPGGAYEYYALCFLTLFAFVPAILLSDKKIFLSLLIPVILLGINTVLQTSDEFSLGPKKALIGKVMSIVGQDSFAIEGRGICHNFEGWRYLFKVYGKLPSQSYTDQGLGWLYPDEIVKDFPKYTIILAEDRIPLTEDLSNLVSIKEGGYRAYIRKNENSIPK